MADVFKALAEPVRRSVLDLLARQPLNVNQIADHFPAMSRPAISQHLTVLEEAGLIKIYKAGRERYGCLHRQAFDDLQAWLGKFLALGVPVGEYGILLNPENLSDAEALTQPVMLQAMLSRDARFDGRFYIAVKTTGIYCRPVCSASPKPENVLFFRTSAEAVKGGFRACKRCKP